MIQTFLFQQNQSRQATVILGNAAHTAQRMGYHRDPSHFPYAPWICELRRRLWNYLCCLDALALSSYGAESCLPATADAQPPKNGNDEDWHANRFAKLSSVPLDAKGFKETTFILARRGIAGLTVQLSQFDSNDHAAKERLIRQTKLSLDEKYLNDIDLSNPSQTVVAAFIEVSLSSLRLTLRHRRVMQATASSRDAERYE
ncbi:hypothetical protein BT63DRAFT_200131 [Microthyrium microscopicum]|uniref:Xylanolytic transcriptional activator regulatory domain-containing protein n=1 Tax=Microthyrium microscopicum TaxID=703497 RepID=A0A6A6UH27_9PEZI|nr:hypothetical protein BT63DRAFT_200131 [Microthyrium microscopicum]